LREFDPRASPKAKKISLFKNFFSSVALAQHAPARMVRRAARARLRAPRTRL